MLIRRLSSWPSAGWESPWDEMERMRRQMALLADRFAGGPKEHFAGVFPLINVTEDKNNFYVRAELPGLKAADLEISLTGDSLSIAGERKMETEGEKVTYHRKEREGGKFSRIFTLAGQIDGDKVEARSLNGLLTVTLPKSEASKPKQITVKGY
jgi:HSP20 family protein